MAAEDSQLSALNRIFCV